MLYYFVRPFAREVIRVFFRKIYISGKEKIPKGVPIIIAANHPTAFAEPCVMACFQPRALHFLVRGNLFKKSWANYFLRALHMLPVFRIGDGGYGKVKDNYSTFTYCEDALGKGKSIMIMAEGRCIHEKRLRPLRKGTARIAMGTIERYKDVDVYVVPVGINYTYADQFRSELMIKFHEPLRARDYFGDDAVHPNVAITNFTKLLREKLTENIIIINDKEDDELTEHLFVLDRSHRPSNFLPAIEYTSVPLDREKAIANKVNEMDALQKNDLKAKTSTYFAALEEADTTDRAVVRDKRNFLGTTLFLLLGFIPALLGYTFTFPPAKLAQYLTDTKVKSREFISSVLLGAAAGGYLLYLIIIAIVLANVGSWLWLGVVVALFLTGYFYLYYNEAYQSWREDRQLRKLSDTKVEELKAQRSTIMNAFEFNIETIARSKEQ